MSNGWPRWQVRACQCSHQYDMAISPAKQREDSLERDSAGLNADRRLSTTGVNSAPDRLLIPFAMWEPHRHDVPALFGRQDACPSYAFYTSCLVIKLWSLISDLKENVSMALCWGREGRSTCHYVTLTSGSVEALFTRRTPRLSVVLSVLPHFHIPCGERGKRHDHSSTVFTDNSAERKIIISDIVSLSDTRTEFVPLPEPVSLVFSHHATPVSSASVQCVFWDSSRQAWSERGCHVLSSNATHTSCQCHHLTSFAILAGGDLDTASDETQSILTYVLSALSILCLSLALFTFTWFRGLQCRRNTIHTHLVACLLLGQVIFVSGIQQTDIPTVCEAIAITLHYVYLCAFFWMLLEGCQLYVMFLLPLSREDVVAPFYCGYALGYGVPAFIVIATCAANHRGYGRAQYCWLSPDNGMVWAFMAPVLLVLVLNTAILCVSLVVMVRHSATSQAVRQRGQYRKLLTWTNGTASLMVVLGIPWLLAVPHMIRDIKVFSYIFILCNASQGVSIFLLHCVFNKKVVQQYQILCGRQLLYTLNQTERPLTFRDRLLSPPPSNTALETIDMLLKAFHDTGGLTTLIVELECTDQESARYTMLLRFNISSKLNKLFAWFVSVSTRAVATLMGVHIPTEMEMEMVARDITPDEGWLDKVVRTVKNSFESEESVDEAVESLHWPTPTSTKTDRVDTQPDQTESCVDDQLRSAECESLKLGNGSVKTPEFSAVTTPTKAKTSRKAKKETATVDKMAQAVRTPCTIPSCDTLISVLARDLHYLSNDDGTSTDSEPVVGPQDGISSISYSDSAIFPLSYVMVRQTIRSVKTQTEHIQSDAKMARVFDHLSGLLSFGTRRILAPHSSMNEATSAVTVGEEHTQPGVSHGEKALDVENKHPTALQEAENPSLTEASRPPTDVDLASRGQLAETYVDFRTGNTRDKQESQIRLSNDFVRNFHTESDRPCTADNRQANTSREVPGKKLFLALTTPKEKFSLAPKTVDPADNAVGEDDNTGDQDDSEERALPSALFLVNSISVGTQTVDEKVHSNR